MSNFEFKLNRAGLDELRKSAEMQGILQSHANAVSARAGAGYATSIEMGRDRAVAFVRAETMEAVRDNLENNTLLKAVR
jgi:hypothetical protein